MDKLKQEPGTQKPKKEFRKKIRETLTACFEQYKAELTEKKFNAAIKRASKLIANDLYVKKKKEKKEKAGQLESLVM